MFLSSEGFFKPLLAGVQVLHLNRKAKLIIIISNYAKGFTNHTDHNIAYSYGGQFKCNTCTLTRKGVKQPSIVQL